MSAGDPDANAREAAERVAVVDVGSNSTRLLVAQIVDGRVIAELERRSTVTRLAEGVDGAGRLAPAATERVHAVVERYREAIDTHGATRALAVMTSAVRDAADGEAFRAQLAERHGLDARILAGDDEARLTYAGATSERTTTVPTVVLDVGGGSTELVVGLGAEVLARTSTQVGVVRHSERHLRSDPPAPGELEALRADVRATFAPAAARQGAQAAVAVAGTATTLAAIEVAMEIYDPARIEGHVLELATCEALLARLAATDDAGRRTITGLHPDRAPTIVAGAIILIEAVRAYGLDRVEVSDHDLLRGAALAL